MPTTYFDIGLRPPSETWRSLRRRRATPPLPEKAPKSRAETFRAALEQAEQQFRAAAQVNYDSRALNLFYGLSQASRAIAAASPELAADSWRLSGHGIKIVNSEVKDIRRVAVQTDTSRDKQRAEHPDSKAERSSFRVLSGLLRSVQPENVTLETLWPLLFETTLHAPVGVTMYEPIVVTTERGWLSSLPPFADGTPSHAEAAALVLPNVIRRMSLADRPPLAMFLARYPSLAGWLPNTPSGSPQDWAQPGIQFTLRWPAPDDPSARHILRDRLVAYRGTAMAYPRLTYDADALPVHPLMAWWMVLFAMSMLTRYQPDQWTKMIDVNRSEHATAVEFVLETALASVPDLVDEVIDQVSN